MKVQLNANSSFKTLEIEPNQLNFFPIAANHDPILINGNSELAIFIENEGLSGEGTHDSPYIIEDFNIDASDENGIDIQYTDAYLIIRNCTIDGEKYRNTGICLNNSSNINISNNVISYCYRGFILGSSFNNIVSENKLLYNSVGFFMYRCNNTSIYKNAADFNIYAGMALSYSHNNTLLGDMANRNDIGIFLSQSNNNTISVSVTNNFDEGILLQSSTNNLLIKNEVRNNSWGITLLSSENNKIYLNDIYENREYEAIEGLTSLNNVWDNGTAGNYWGNYTERYPDAKNNGIVWDTPYEIDGVDLGIDNFPLANPVFPEEQYTISGFSLVYMLFFISVGVFLLKKKN